MKDELTPFLTKRAQEMRHNPTDGEVRLWRALSGSKLGGYKFRRQKVIGRRIVDFFCPAKCLIVEVDGDTHNRESDLAMDAALLAETGIATIRFTNGEVMNDMDAVLDALLGKLRNLPDRWPCTILGPSPEEER